MSVVIPAVNEAAEIADAVRSAKAPGVEVVVVDAGSRDGTRERAEAAGARVVVAERGRARQLARGVLETQGDVVVFLHSDTRLPDGFAPAIGKALDDPSVVGGAFRFQFREGEGEGTPGSRALAVVEWGTRLRVAWLGLPYGDQALFVRRTTLAEVGGVPDVALMEDLDLVTALKRVGRLAHLELPATTSPRRYLDAGVARTVAGHFVAMVAWRLGVDRERIAGWLSR